MPNTPLSSASPDLYSPLVPPPAKSSAGGYEPGGASEKLCIDDMLRKYCGEFGYWQLRHFVLTSLAWALEAFHTMVMIFADREPEWRCVKQDCSSGGKSVCGIEPGSWEWIGGAGSSTVAEWGLVCGEKYKVGLVQALFFCGCMFGMSLLFLFSLIIHGPSFTSNILFFNGILKNITYLKKICKKIGE